jgi:EmrB/QacA subfamily drug resistance transporter
MTLAVLAALVLVLLLAVLDQTIVAIALPVIVRELGELSHLSWIVTAYLLASTIVAPLYGKLGDMYGRKIVLQTAIVIFLVGSVLCGLSQSTMQLVFARGLQGIGGGGLIVTVMALVGDLVPPRERGRYQGVFGGVFGIATIVGPPLGGFLVDHLSWRWIFYINLPTGAFVLLLVGTVLRLRAPQQQGTIDYLGAILLAVALTAVVLCTSLGGTVVAWASPGAIGLLVLAIAGSIAFVVAEIHADDPILPLGLLRNRTFAIACTVTLIINVSLLGSVTYLPIYLQVVKGQNPSASGLELLPMMLGMIVTSVASGQMISRWGHLKPFPIAGTAVMAVGLVMLSRLSSATPIWQTSGAAAVVGLGLGMVTQVLVLAAQDSVDFKDLGVATSGTQLFRSLGGALGVAIFGAIFANELHALLGSVVPASADIFPGAALSRLATFDRAMYTVYIESVAAALRPIFIVAAATAALACALSCVMPRSPLHKSS